MREVRAWLGLGGNIGDVPAAMAKALRQLNDDPQIAVGALSPIYRTPPWGLEDQPWFHNCCAEVTTGLEPEELLDRCQGAERAGKRERKVRWGPRTIDIDIIDVEGNWPSTERLALPHPRVRPVGMDDAAVDHRGVDPARVQQGGHHRRGGGLAMGARHGDVGFQPHQLGQHFSPAHNRQAARTCGIQFRIARLDRG